MTIKMSAPVFEKKDLHEKILTIHFHESDDGQILFGYDSECIYVLSIKVEPEGSLLALHKSGQESLRSNKA